jgi:predicted Zn-dependent peptidase
MFGGGSRLEDDRLAGVSHFIEHLFFKGTHKRPSPKEIADAIEGVGGFINASTDKELTAYWTRVPAEYTELGLDVLFDIVSNSKLDPADIERERAVILEELKMYQDQPQDHVQNLFEELIWPGHPLGRDIAGTQESVSRLTRDDILEYADAHYRLPNVVVGVAGALDENAVVELVRPRLTLLGGLNGHGAAAPPGALDGAHVMVRRQRTEQAHICLGVRAYSYLHPDRYAIDLLNTLLGEGMSSRLFLNIRERLGIAYDVHSFMQKHRDTGYVAVYLGVDPTRRWPRMSSGGRRSSPRGVCGWTSKRPMALRSGSPTRSCCSARSRPSTRSWLWSTPSPSRTSAVSLAKSCEGRFRWRSSDRSRARLVSGRQ